MRGFRSPHPSRNSPPAGLYNPVVPQPHAHSYRWVVLSLLFAATTINYLDRIVLGIMLPDIRKEMDLDYEAYGYITGAFQIAYTAGFLVAGRFIDRFGTK